MTEDLVQSESEDSLAGRVTIAVLVLLIVGLLAACGFLWTHAHDATMQANGEARVRIMKAEEEAARARQEVMSLREQLKQVEASVRECKMVSGSGQSLVEPK